MCPAQEAKKGGSWYWMGLQPNKFTSSRLLKSLGFWPCDECANKNEVSWNALTTGYARKGKGKRALCMFQETQRVGFKSARFTHSSMFGVFSTTKPLGARKMGSCT
ncbi:uncharacterized protein J3R85_006336 [Psidium guajava]|nr:uncharacterized protein J3R85_006336 [Psidium guajava]